VESACDLRRLVRRWLLDGEAQGWSAKSLTDRRIALEHLAWWLENEAEAPALLASLTPDRLRAFLGYVRAEHPNGRWGHNHPATQRKARPSTVRTYYRDIRAFCGFSEAEGLLPPEVWPLHNVKAPHVPKDQVQPFTPEQVQALADAARRSRHPERDLALLLLLIDSGLRVSELCSLTIGHFDRGSGALHVTGKGDKRRAVYMGVGARRALWRYVETEPRSALDPEPLFRSEGGHTLGAALTPSGVFQIVQRLGRVADLQGVRRSPHTCRHTFAIQFLRSGGNLLTLQELLGHADVAVLRKYVHLGQLDLAQAHRAASPIDRLRIRCPPDGASSHPGRRPAPHLPATRNPLFPATPTTPARLALPTTSGLGRRAFHPPTESHAT
jgi:integrase/recombinase XerD